MKLKRTLFVVMLGLTLSLVTGTTASGEPTNHFYENPTVALASQTTSATANEAAIGDMFRMVVAARQATVAVTTPDGFGTGFVINDGGLILTNYHVIHGNNERIRIWFYDKEIMNFYEGIVVGIDPIADLALIKAFIPDYLLPLPYLTIEHRNKEINVIDDVYAIGHPGGLDWTITEGIISHTNRNGRIGPYVRIIQHSATIAQGSSGGPLINTDGKVVGVNTYVLGEQKNFAYAVRGDVVYHSLKEMLQRGTVIYPALGIRTVHLNPLIREKMIKENPNTYIPDIFGLMVWKNEEGTHGLNNGLLNGDIIIDANGHPINNIDDMADVMVGKYPGQKMSLLIIRNRVLLRVEYTLTSLDFDYMTYYNERKEEQKTPKSPPEKKPESRFPAR